MREAGKGKTNRLRVIKQVCYATSFEKMIKKIFAFYSMIYLSILTFEGLFRQKNGTHRTRIS